MYEVFPRILFKQSNEGIDFNLTTRTVSASVAFFKFFFRSPIPMGNALWLKNTFDYLLNSRNMIIIIVIH